MDGEGLDLVQRLGTEAAGTEELKTGDPRKIVYHVCKDGTSKEFVVPPAMRSHAVHTVDDLINFSNRAKEFHDSAAKPVVWHDHDGLLLVINDADRRDVVRLKLLQGRQFSKVKSLTETHPDGRVENVALSQSELVKLLSRDLRGTVLEKTTEGGAADGSGDLIGKLRQIKFSSTDEATGEVQRGRESMDRSIKHDLANATNLPETVVLTLPVYDNADLFEMVELVGCSLDVDLEERKFYFLPLPGELETAVHNAQAKIRKLLDAQLVAGTPVYHGKVSQS